MHRNMHLLIPVFSLDKTNIIEAVANSNDHLLVIHIFSVVVFFENEMTG